LSSFSLKTAPTRIHRIGMIPSYRLYA